MADLLNTRLCDFVTANYNYADLFYKLKLDFCCHGRNTLAEAIKEANADEATILQAIAEFQQSGHSEDSSAIPFEQWPLDLVIDYVLKRHHRHVYDIKDDLLALLDKVVSVHADKHSELLELQEMVHFSIDDLVQHFKKEENILFPYVIKLFMADRMGQSEGPMHCGSVLNPINVMEMEHAREGERYKKMLTLTNNFTAPEDACGSYELLYRKLAVFVRDLFEHIHLENNIIFPKALQLEKKVVSAKANKGILSKIKLS